MRKFTKRIAAAMLSAVCCLSVGAVCFAFPASASVSEPYSVARGTYRLKVTHKAYNSSGSVAESFTLLMITQLTV